MEEPEDPRIGTTLLGKLRVDGLLGEGGMGAVYRVHHEVTKHDRALKVLHAEFADDEVIYQRLLREAGVAGTLRTDHVVETFDVGKLGDGSPYVLMELMDGETLAERMMGDRLPVATLVGFVCQACEGIGHAHAAGIIHRDLKPDNLFIVDEDGRDRVKLLDFGISKFHIEPLKEGGAVTQEGTVMGTPLYMSPEQAAGKTVGPQTDLYSLGVILYEGLTGQTPHEAESYPAFLLKLHTERPRPVSELAPDVPAGLAAVVDKALATSPEDRYPSAQALLRVLVPFAEGASAAHLRTFEGLPAVSPPIAAPPRPPSEPPRASDAPSPRRPSGIDDTLAAGGVDPAPVTVRARPARSEPVEEPPTARSAAAPEPPRSSPPVRLALLAAVAVLAVGAVAWAVGRSTPRPPPAAEGGETESAPSPAAGAAPPAAAEDAGVWEAGSAAVGLPEAEAPPAPAAVPPRVAPPPDGPPARPPPADRPPSRFEIERDNPY